MKVYKRQKFAMSIQQKKSRLCALLHNKREFILSRDHIKYYHLPSVLKVKHIYTIMQPKYIV